MAKLTDLQRLTIDIINGTVPSKFNNEDFSASKAEQMVRQAIVDACGGEWNFYKFQKNKWDVYAIISEVLTAPAGRSIEGVFGDLVEVHDTNLGDTKNFEIENTDLFKVGVSAQGTQDVRRQEIYSKSLSVDTDRLTIKIYAEIDMFISGRINFPRMVERVNKSFDNKVANLVADALYNAYTKDARLVAPYKANGTTVSDDALIDLVSHVEAATGSEVVIMGTAKALGKIPNAQPSEIAKREKELLGYYGSFHSRGLVEIPQVHKNGTDTFSIADDFLMVIPVSDKPVKVLYEGQATVYDGEAKDNSAEQIEFFYGRKVGVMVLCASKYGYWKFA